jgi:5'-nucleotidase
VTYGEAFTVQPFGNTLVVKTCTGQQIYEVLNQQFNNPSAGQTGSCCRPRTSTTS